MMKAFKLLPGCLVLLLCATAQAQERPGGVSRSTVTNIVVNTPALNGSFDNALNFAEPWRNLTAWTSVSQVVSNGYIYDSLNGNPSGASYNFPLGTLDTARISTTFFLPAASGGLGYIFFGVSNTATNASPSAGGAGQYGIGVQNSGSSSYNQISWFGGISAGNSNLTAGTWALGVQVDTNLVSYVLRGPYPNPTNEFYYTNSRANIGTINNVMLWNSDPRFLSGVGIGPVGIHRSTGSAIGSSTMTNDFVAQTVDDFGQPIRVHLPPNYDARKTAPMIVVCHGNGNDQQFPNTGQGALYNPEQAYFYGLVTNGFIVASSYQHGNNWGSSAGVADIKNLINWTKAHYGVSRVYLMGLSMGALSSLTFLNQQQDQIAGYIGLYPVCSLVSMTNSFWQTITNAYGIGTYSTATLGYDPSVLIGGVTFPDRYQGVPMRFYASPSDVTVNWNSNAIYFTNIVGGFVRESAVVQCSGGHGDPSHYQLSDTLAFLGRCETNLNAYTPAFASISAATNKFYGSIQAQGITANGSATVGATLTVSSGTITNGGVVWHYTNVATPTLAYPNGSLATTSDGGFWIRTNSTWVRH